MAEKVSSVEEAELRERLIEMVAAMKTLLEAGDLPAMAPGFGELQEAWTSYQEAQTEQARAAEIVPYSRQHRPRLRSQLLGSMESLALLQPHPDLSGLEAKLDLIDAELEAGFSGADCLDQLTALSGELLEIGNRLFSTFLLVAAGGEIVGEGRLAITVGPSPISLARSLASFFLSVRTRSRARPMCAAARAGGHGLGKVDQCFPESSP